MARRISLKLPAGCARYLSLDDRRHIWGLERVLKCITADPPRKMTTRSRKRCEMIAYFFDKAQSRQLPPLTQGLVGTFEGKAICRINNALRSPVWNKMNAKGRAIIYGSTVAVGHGPFAFQTFATYRAVMAYRDGYQDAYRGQVIILDGCYGAGKRR